MSYLVGLDSGVNRITSERIGASKGGGDKFGVYGTVAGVAAIGVGVLRDNPLLTRLGIAATVAGTAWLNRAVGLDLFQRVLYRLRGEETGFSEEVALGTKLNKSKCDFGDYLEPNEWNPERVGEHLQYMKPGWIISTGTERSLFDLICAPECCEGLIVRDINWKVKAYIDCIVLLLKICDTQEEFLKLSAIPPTNSLDCYNTSLLQRCGEILQRIDESKLISFEMKRYYKKNLNDLVDVYVGSFRDWDTGLCVMKRNDPNCFMQVNYLKKPELFYKLQAYARKGKIIATIGSIDDLEFLKQTRIKPSIMDVSNIPDYAILKVPKGVDMIWTDGQAMRTQYYSSFKCPLTLLSPEEQKEFSILVNSFKNPNETEHNFILRFDHMKLYLDKRFSGPLIHSKEAFDFFKAYNNKETMEKSVEEGENRRRARDQ